MTMLHDAYHRRRFSRCGAWLPHFGPTSLRSGKHITQSDVTCRAPYVTGRGRMSSPDTFPHNYLSTSPAHGVPGQPFLYAGPLRSPTPILLELPVPSQAPDARERYANYVWNASVVLADKVAGREIDAAGKRVLELGCGLGLPGIVAARMGARQVRAPAFRSSPSRLCHSPPGAGTLVGFLGRPDRLRRPGGIARYSGRSRASPAVASA